VILQRRLKSMGSQFCSFCLYANNHHVKSSMVERVWVDQQSLDRQLSSMYARKITMTSNNCKVVFMFYSGLCISFGPSCYPKKPIELFKVQSRPHSPMTHQEGIESLIPNIRCPIFMTIAIIMMYINRIMRLRTCAPCAYAPYG